MGEEFPQDGSTWRRRGRPGFRTPNCHSPGCESRFDGADEFVERFEVAVERRLGDMQEIKNRMTQLRWWAEKVAKQNVVARTNAAYGIPDRVYVTNESKAKPLDVDQLAQIPDPYVRMSLRPEAELGLRRAESIKVNLKRADCGDRLVLKGTRKTSGSFAGSTPTWVT